MCKLACIVRTQDVVARVIWLRQKKGGKEVKLILKGKIETVEKMLVGLMAFYGKDKTLMEVLNEQPKRTYWQNSRVSC